LCMIHLAVLVPVMRIVIVEARMKSPHRAIAAWLGSKDLVAEVARIDRIYH
jgi:hypothetical protein